MSSFTFPQKTLAQTLRHGERFLLRNSCLVILASVALWISARIQMPFWPVPVTMQTFVVLVLGMTLGWRLGAMAILVYFVQDALGLPGFSGTPEKGIGSLHTRSDQRLSHRFHDYRRRGRTACGKRVRPRRFHRQGSLSCRQCFHLCSRTSPAGSRSWLGQADIGIGTLSLSAEGCLQTHVYRGALPRVLAEIRRGSKSESETRREVERRRLSSRVNCVSRTVD